MQSPPPLPHGPLSDWFGPSTAAQTAVCSSAWESSAWRAYIKAGPSCECPRVRGLTATASALGEGDLDARAGQIEGGPELVVLATTLDDMAARLQGAQERERQIEATRRDLGSPNR
jgi:HAMP domain